MVFYGVGFISTPQLALLVLNVTAAKKEDILNVLTMVGLLKDSLASPGISPSLGP